MSFPVLAETIEVEFAHFSQNRDEIRRISAEPGDLLEVRIAETCPSHFDYVAFGVERTPSQTDRLLATGECNASESAVLPIVLAANYSGYAVRITPKGTIDGWLKRPDFSGACTMENADCKPAREITLTLVLVDSPFDLEFAGGFTISRLVSPRFAVRNQSVNGTSTSVIVRDAAAEDSEDLGLNGMIHVSHEKLPIAASFGLGIGDESKTNYFLGVSWRAGGKFFLTLGRHWGPVNRLPTGVQLGDVLTDANALNTLPTRMDSETFIAVSYSFLDIGRNLFSGGFAPPSGEGGAN